WFATYPETIADPVAPIRMPTRPATATARRPYRTPRTLLAWLPRGPSLRPGLRSVRMPRARADEQAEPAFVPSRADGSGGSACPAVPLGDRIRVAFGLPARA